MTGGIISERPPPPAGTPAAAGWPPWLVPAVLSAGCGLLMLGGTPLATDWSLQREAVAQGQWWRLLTCNFVHLGLWHYLFNVASLAVLPLLCPERLPGREWALRLVVLSLSVGVGIELCVPWVGMYVGLSGVVYGLFLLGLGRMALQGDRFAMLCVAYLLGRVGLELYSGTAAWERRMIGGEVVAESHVCGFAGAALLGGLQWLRQARRPRARSQP